MEDFLSGEAGSNIVKKGDFLILNVEFLEKKELDMLPKVVDKLVAMEGVNSALVYGIYDGAMYMVGKERGKKLERVMKRKFSTWGRVDKIRGFSATTVPMGIINLLDRDALLSVAERIIVEAFLDGEGSRGFSTTYHRLEDVKRMVCSTAKAV